MQPAGLVNSQVFISPAVSDPRLQPVLIAAIATRTVIMHGNRLAIGITTARYSRTVLAAGSNAAMATILGAMGSQELRISDAIPVHLRGRGTLIPAEPDPAAGAPVCLAPAMMLYLDPDGDVRPCCRNHVALGNVGRTRLPDIWWGRNRELLEESVTNLDFSLGCFQCADVMDTEGRELAYPSNFDRYASDLAPERSSRWPLRMEFNLSNSCNLQCIQCNGFLSSSIRLHREGRPPLPKVYDDQFFEDLEAFIPHLVDAQFAGGEPFLAAESFRVWDLVKRLNPELPCMTVTNATQWNRRIQEVIEDLSMGFVFSLDGVTKKTYEAVRIGADFGSVMANVERYSAIANRNERPLEVNYCHMVQNYQSFPDVLRWGEERGMKVNVSVVRDPVECSLAAADDTLLRGVLRTYEMQYDAVAAELMINLPAWEEEIVRIRGWLHAGPGGRVVPWGEWDYFVERRHTRAVRALEQFAVRTAGRATCEARLDEHGKVLEVNEEFALLAGTEPGDLVGRNADTELAATFEARFGSQLEIKELVQNGDLYEADILAGDRALRLVLMPTPGMKGPRRTTVLIVDTVQGELGVPFIDARDWPI